MVRSGARHPARDDGFSLTEIMVTMSVMSVVTLLFTTGVAQLFAAQRHSDAVTSATQQIHTAFLRLDRDIRYASGINTGSTVASGNTYVAYAITNTGIVICNQLRLTPAGLLQARQKTGAAAVGGWQTLASELIQPSSLTTYPATDGGNAYQQLVVSLTARGGGATAAERETATFTFTALNSSVATSDDVVCNSLDMP